MVDRIPVQFTLLERLPIWKAVERKSDEMIELIKRYVDAKIGESITRIESDWYRSVDLAEIEAELSAAIECERMSNNANWAAERD